MNSSHTESLSTLRIGWLPGFQLLKSPTTLMAVALSLIHILFYETYAESVINGAINVNVYVVG